MAKESSYLKIFFIFLPLSILFIVSVFPLGYSLYISLFRGVMEKFIGLENYYYLIQDPRFIDAIRVTLTFTAITVGSQTIIGLLLAFVLIQPIVRGRSFWQTLFLLPLVIPPIVAGVMFKILYHPAFGPSSYLNFIGIKPPLWLEDPTMALISVCIINIWMWTPFAFLIFYSGIRAIPQEILEAAIVDGASGFRMLTDIILPHIKALILVVVLFRTLDNFTAFDEIMGSTAGGPGFSTTTFAIYAYKLAFKSWDLGYAAAASTIMFLISVTIGVMLVRMVYRG